MIQTELLERDPSPGLWALADLPASTWHAVAFALNNGLAVEIILEAVAVVCNSPGLTINTYLPIESPNANQ